MRADDAVLAELAASVADGQSIDWGAAESSAAAPSRRLVRHLRLVDSIATLYRSIPAEEQELIRARIEPPAGTEPAGPRWGRLVLLERIGHGTSCEVYRAWDTDLHREVALKLLHEDAGGRTGDTHARVLREARHLARLRHEHVVQVYGAEQHDGRVGLWMELVRGESLERVLAARGTFGAAEAAAIGQDVCAALAAVHAAGLVHRDVKAQNVMRESGGRTVLMDFGTGEALSESTGTATLAGTPLYLAPEIFKGTPASPQSDLYSLGVLLYYLVSGRFPVTAGSVEQLARAHARGSARRLRDARPDLAPAFVRAIDRALEPDPQARYRTAGEMEAALRDSALRGDTAGTQPRPAGSILTRLGGSGVALAAGLVLLVAGALAAIVWSRDGAGATAAGVRPVASVAVLPLEDVSGSRVSPYLADALTDQLIATLGQIGAVRVASRTSIMQFKGAKPSMQQVFDALGVDAVVEGSVAVAQAEGDLPARVRVNARLISAASGMQLWSRTLERPLGDTLALEAELAKHIAESVRATVTESESRRLSQAHSTSGPAEEAYFQGRYHLGQYGNDRARRALEAFNRAVELDPSHAAARSGAARSYVALGFGGALSQPEARARALAEVQRALEIDPEQADAHVALGDLKFFYDWDWRGADAAYRRAIDLNGSFAYGRTQYARYLAAAQRLDAAAAEAHAAAAMDPLSADAAQTLGLILFFKRDDAAAIQALERALQLDPRHARARAVLGRVYDAQGQPERAIEETQRGIALSDEAGMSWQMQLIRLHAVAGRRDEARARFAALARDAEARGLRIAAEHRGYLHLALGDKEAALADLERAVADRDPAVLWLAVDPRVDALKDNPRFQRLIAALGTK